MNKRTVQIHSEKREKWERYVIVGIILFNYNVIVIVVWSI